MIEALQNAKRPLLIYGAGIHIAHAESAALAFAERLNIPVIFTWGARDLFHHDHPLNFGGFGTHGVRHANWAMQNADFILTIGTRLDTKATGWPRDSWAPKATIYMVDIDRTEINKFGAKVNGICCDMTEFFSTVSLAPIQCDAWKAQIAAWRAKYPPGMQLHALALNPYRFVDQLSDLLRPDDVIVSDTGCSLAWMMQAFRFKGQRFLHAWNQTPMGYGLPAAVGAAFVPGVRRVICITGDGGLGECTPELATINRHDLNVKVILFNNFGHAMCQQTERTWMGGVHASTDYGSGLATPDYDTIARAYDIRLHVHVKDLLAEDGPGFLSLHISNLYHVAPQSKAGAPLEDMEPSLPEEVIKEIMNVESQL